MNDDETERWHELYTIYHGLEESVRLLVDDTYYFFDGGRLQSLEYALMKHGYIPCPVAEPEPMDDTEYNETLMAQDIYHDLQTR